MAVWQFDFHLLPTEGILRRYKVMPIAIPGADFDQGELIIGFPTLRELEIEFSKILPPLQSWSEQLKQWGHDDGNRIDDSYEESGISSIFVRVDVRSISHLFVVAVLDMARQHALRLRTPDGRLFQPSYARLLSAIQTSDSFRFVQDPHVFFDALGRAKADEESKKDA